MLAVSVLLVIAATLSLAIGAYPIPLARVLDGTLSDSEWSVLTRLRVPRVLASCVGGVAFATAGAALQSLFRNPLAEPGLLGVPSAAGLGAATALIVLGHGTGLWLGALIGAGIVMLGMLMAMRRTASNLVGGTITLLLLGVAINAACAAGIALLTALATEGELKTLAFWMLGSFASLTWPQVIAMATATMLGALALSRESPALGALALGERSARMVGVSVTRLRLRIALVTTAMVACVTAFCGSVAFVGLAAPHIARLMVGAAPRRVLPLSALLGALLCVLADLVARAIAAPIELPVGAITSILGVPLMVWLVTRRTSAL